MKTVKEQVKDFLDIEFEELKKFADSIDDQALESAKNLILEAEKNHNRVHVTGIGKPAMWRLSFLPRGRPLMSFTGQSVFTEALDRWFRETWLLRFQTAARRQS